MDIDVVLVSVITAICVVIAEKTIGFFFFKTESKIKLKQEHETKILDKGLGMHSEMIELIKISKNAIREILSTETSNISYQTLLDLHESSRLFSKNLTTYEMFISPELYKKLHYYKHLLQDCVVLIDGITSPERTKSEDSDLIITLMHEQLKNKFTEINSSFDQLVKEIIKTSRSTDLPDTG